MMEKFDWKLTIRLNMMMLKFAGLWPGKDTYKLDFYTLWAVVAIALFLFGHVFFQTCVLFFIEDLQTLTESTFILISEMIVVTKVYCLVKSMKKLKQLMVTLDSELFQPKNEDQRNLVLVSLNLWRTMYKIFCVMVIGALFFFAMFPVLDKSVKEYRLPLTAWYPFDTKRSPLYEITYIYQVTSLVFIAIISGNTDTLIAALNIYVGTQFDILCDNLRNLVPGDFGTTFIKSVLHHQEILRFARDSMAFYNWILFVQFFASAVSIALTLFQLTVVIPFSNEFYTLISYENGIIIQIFLYCWFGNEVEIKSNEVSYAAFESDWTKASQKHRKDLIFFMMNTQKPLKIASLNLFYLSLETFVKILRVGWSYFAVLQRVNSGK